MVRGNGCSKVRLRRSTMRPQAGVFYRDVRGGGTKRGDGGYILKSTSVNRAKLVRLEFIA